MVEKGVGRSTREFLGVREALARLQRRRWYQGNRAVKGAPDAPEAYLTEYDRLKKALEAGEPVYPAQHQQLSGLFHRLSPAQQAKFKGKSPGCLFSRADGPEGRY